MCGIYGIHNLVTDKWYVGQAQDIEKRNRAEKINLRKGYLHSNKECNGSNQHLGNAYKKYGEDEFEWVILEECSIADLNDREMFWIAEKDSFNNGYNLTIGGDGTRGYTFSEDSKQKLSELRIGENNPFYGKSHSEETKQKMSEHQKGERAFWYGKHLSSDVKQKISNTQIENKGRRVLCIETNQVYLSLSLAAEKTGVSKSNICSVCNGTRKTAGGYHWKYTEYKES